MTVRPSEGGSVGDSGRRPQSSGATLRGRSWPAVATLLGAGQYSAGTQSGGRAAMT
jgi:hypothetical protein